MTDTPCPFCGGATRRHLSAPDRNRGVSKLVFDVRQCTKCGLFFVANPPADIGRYYTADYHFVPQTAADLDARLPAQQFKIDLLKRFQSGGALMEIGPSNGIFCRLAQQNGFDVSAIEVDSACVSFLGNALGVAAVESGEPDKALASDPRRFQAICLWHAIEHLPRPWAVIQECAAHLAPGGVLVISAPNPLSRQARLMRSYWPHWDLPRHIFNLPIPWLVARAREHGLTELLVTTRDQGSLEVNSASWPILGTRFPPWFRGPRRVLSWCQHALRSREEAEGYGAAYTAVFRRP